MKLVKITTVYPAYLNKFYDSHPELAGKNYAEQKAILDYDGFGWADFWSKALNPLGYEVMEVTLNNAPLQRVWAMENGLPNATKVALNEIALEQVKKFRPVVLWFDHHDEILLKRIRLEVPSIRLVLGFVGSAIPLTNVWCHMDLIISCAQESVDRLHNKGFRAEQLHHAFDPRINDHLQSSQKQIELSFIGHIVRRNQFHKEREYILEELCKKLSVKIYSPSADMTFMDDFKVVLGKGVYGGMQIIRKLGIPAKALATLPKVGVAALWSEMPMRQVNTKLKPFMNSGVFGLEMYQTLRDSIITLNIHADSSTTHASNMRLFEATGVGTCLLTDWKENLHEFLF